MKKILTALCLIVGTTMSGQTEKGNFMLSVNTSFGRTGTAQIGFETEKRKGYDFESNPQKSFSLNISPRAGIFLANNFSIGRPLFSIRNGLKRSHFWR